MRNSARPERAGNEPTSRREMLRRIFSTGLATTAGAGMTGLLTGSTARAATPQVNNLPATMVLNALPADAPPSIAAAIEAGCCVTYTLDEHNCGTSSCGTGWCCYHIVSSCGVNEVQCIEVSCAEGNFTTGC